MEFFKKWGILIVLIFNILIFFSTCGTKGKIDKLEKRVNTLENSINFNDSINKKMATIDREILMNETSREIIYNWNAVVRTVERPDDIMNKYNLEISRLNKLKSELKDVKR